MRLLLVAMLSGATVLAQVKVPRPAPELAVEDWSGRLIRLSEERGHVVLVGFISTSCVHCQAVSGTLNDLYAEFGKRGFRVVEAAFDNGDPELFANRFHLAFPVGHVDRGVVMSFMGSSDRRLGTPQLAIVDRRGLIQAQSEPQGSPLLQQPEVLRHIIERLLR